MHSTGTIENDHRFANNLHGIQSVKLENLVYTFVYQLHKSLHLSIRSVFTVCEPKLRDAQHCKVKQTVLFVFIVIIILGH